VVENTELSKKNQNLSFYNHPKSQPHFPQISLECTSTIFLINMTVSLLLLSVLEQHGCGEDQSDVDTYNSKCAGEDQIQEVVGVC
jgi:hypothetical protein